MTVQRFTLVPGWIDCAGRTRTWKLIDAQGKLRCEMTTKTDAETVIEALNMADLLVANCGRVGLVIPEAVRGQRIDAPARKSRKATKAI